MVLLAGLVGDSLTLPRYWNATTVGSLVRQTLNPLLISDPSFSSIGLELYVLRGSDGLRVIDPEVESWDELSAFFSAGGPSIVQCMLTDSIDRSGFWSWTTERHFRGIVLAPIGGDWSEEQLADARRAIFIESNLSPASWASMQPWTDVAAADIRSVRVLWGGVAHDALAITLFGALVYSLTGWPAWFAAHPLSRRARRIARGLCPSCGYDLRGIEACLCPECGRPLTLDSP